VCLLQRSHSPVAAVRVLHVSLVRDRQNRGGDALLDAWPTLPAVAEAVHGAGAEVDVLVAAHRDEQVERGGVRYHFVAEPRLPSRRLISGAMPWRIARAAAALRPDVVHVNGLGFPLHVRPLTGVAPVLVQDHAHAPPRRLRAVHRWGMERVRGVAFTAREQALPFVRAGVLRQDVPVFEIPESSTRFTPGDRDRARAETGVHGDPALLWVGRLNDNKDPLTIVEAFSRAARALPDAHLWCCFAEAPLLDRIRVRLQGDPVLAARVHLLGTVPHARVEMLCRAADFFISGSRSESTGYAPIEAMACGATPILSDIPAFRATTGRGAVGALAPVGDADAFAAAIAALAARPREELRARTLDHFRRNLSFPVLGARLAAAYQAIVAGGPSPAETP
jgi:glycosyltransferase involved in cell wall biosynthesis